MLAGVILSTALIHILADAAGDLSNPCLQLSTGAPVFPPQRLASCRAHPSIAAGDVHHRFVDGSFMVEHYVSSLALR